MTRIHKLFAMGWKKWLFLIGGLVLVWGGGRWAYQHFFSQEAAGSDYLSNDMVVEKGDISNVLTMNGKAKFSSTQKLTFQNTGKITAVYKKVGDLVKAGEVVAKMDSYEVDNELEQAKIDLENEQRALEKAQDTSKRELAILQAEKAYQALLYQQENAHTSLSLAIQAIENEFTNRKNDYEKLLSNYEKNQKSYESKKKTYEEIMALDKSHQILYSDEVLKNKVGDLQLTVDGVRKELDALDKLMLYTDKYGTKKPDYYIYIGAKDQFVKSLVERLFYEVSSIISLIDTWAKSGVVLTLPEVSLKSQLIQQYEKVKELAEKKTELSLAVDKMFDASISSEGISWSAVTISDGRTLKDTALTAIDEILGLATPETIGEKRKQELVDLELELEKMSQEVEKSQIEASQFEVEKLKKISDTKMDYEMKDLELKIAKTALDDLEKGENEEIKLILNTIKQKKKLIETIQKKYDAYVLKANFDGVITKMNIQLGDTIGGGASSATSEEKYVYIENPDNLEIQVDVDQSDIARISVWMPVQIVLDALPGSPYTGTLLEIDTTSQGNDSNYGGGATTYKAKVVFTKKPEDTILGAMTARLKIVLEEVFDVVLAPNIAISRGFEGTFVMKAEQGKYKKVPVELGLSDQANTEILTGLVKGDMIMGVFIDKEGMDVAGVNDDNTAMRAEGGWLIGG